MENGVEVYESFSPISSLYNVEHILMRIFFSLFFEMENGVEIYVRSSPISSLYNVEYIWAMKTS